MKPWSALRLSAKSKSLFVIVAVGLTVAGTLQIACKSNPATTAASTSGQAEARRSSTLPAATPRNQPPQCPTFGPTLPPQRQPRRRDHTQCFFPGKPVLLSIPSTRRRWVIVFIGGQILRTRRLSFSTQSHFPRGSNAPIIRCKMVINNYYVVRAVSAGNAYSDPSKPARASVPITPGSNSSGYSAPLCRQP
jgi:hypothetical protein